MLHAAAEGRGRLYTAAGREHVVQAYPPPSPARGSPPSGLEDSYNPITTPAPAVPAASSFFIYSTSEKCGRSFLNTFSPITISTSVTAQK